MVAFLANQDDDEVILNLHGHCMMARGIVVPGQPVDDGTLEEVKEFFRTGWEARAGFALSWHPHRFWLEVNEADKYAGYEDLVFFRKFQELREEDPLYIELRQELQHSLEVHWRSEHSAFCRIDSYGDVACIVSVTLTRDPQFILVTIDRESLERYLHGTGKSYVWKIDFNMFTPGKFPGWRAAEPLRSVEIPSRGKSRAERRLIPGAAGYILGTIERPMVSTAAEALDKLESEWGRGRQDREYESFLALDMKTGRVVDISTHPDATTNYFEREPQKPFELSPAFFRKDVLTRYKSDRDKYHVEEREVSCRNSWYLRGLDTNQAGQVHTYICDLRVLPYEEQRYWKAFNENPRGGLSKRAIANDFHGTWFDPPAGLFGLVDHLRTWDKDGVWWWTLRDYTLFDTVLEPVQNNRDEWANACLELAKLVIEGFNKKRLKKELDQKGIDWELSLGNLGLLELLLDRSTGDGDSSRARLSALRELQYVRTTMKAHVGGTKSVQLVRKTIATHGSLEQGFRDLCTAIDGELCELENKLRS